ncbi:hypothetical protein NDU88_002885 [Pleurodeles waltl]|uniref:Uncharacterized protein n=1 Tax=Pleurodeles waltl TaxID=8319 RepID=A0AAV7NPE9_PLEWA|nr:hypothetical protein NDU88_002885 [Pleurodeles waltl]
MLLLSQPSITSPNASHTRPRFRPSVQSLEEPLGDGAAAAKTPPRLPRLCRPPLALHLRFRAVSGSIRSQRAGEDPTMAFPVPHIVPQPQLWRIQDSALFIVEETSVYRFSAFLVLQE